MKQMNVSTPCQAGLYVRRTREAQGKTRAQLARAARVSERLLASLELGDAPGIQLDKLLAVCHALGLELCLQAAQEQLPEGKPKKQPRTSQEKESEQLFEGEPGQAPKGEPLIAACPAEPSSGYGAAWDEFMAAQGVQAPSLLGTDNRTEG